MAEVEKLMGTESPLEVGQKINEIIEKGTGGGGAGLQLFDTILKDHMLTYEESKGLALQGTYVYKEAIAGSRYGYPDFYNKCLEEKESATATEVTLGSSTITMYVDSNGHQYYDIANKDVIDTFFGTYGYAWFYGVDTENERIFLPRENLLKITEQETLPVSVYGNGKTLGLTIGSNRQFMLKQTATAEEPLQMIEHTPQNLPFTTGNVGQQGNNNYSLGLHPMASLSGVVGDADLSSLIQQETKKYLYICVGNTETVSSVTDVIDITTTENDTIPLLHHIPADELLENPSWLRSAGQWNDGNVYTTVYNYLVNEYQTGSEHTDTLKASDGTEYTVTYRTNKGKKVVDVANVSQVDMVYSAIGSAWYYVIDQDNMTFRLPMSHNSECYTSDPTRVGSDVSAGLPNITGTLNGAEGGTVNGAFKRVNDESTPTGSGGNYNIGSKQDFDASRCSAVYGNSDTVTPPHTEFYLYFKVANAVQNLELLNAGEVLEAVNNLIPNNSSLITNYLMPDYSTQVSTSTSGYVCPYNCLIIARSKHENRNANDNLSINGISVATIRDQIYNTSSSADLTVPLYASKDDVITWTGNATIFVYKLKGDM